MALLETSYSTSEAAKHLKVDASRIRQRLREHSLLGIYYDGEKRLPRFQFERQQVIPGSAVAPGSGRRRAAGSFETRREGVGLCIALVSEPHCQGHLWIRRHPATHLRHLHRSSRYAFWRRLVTISR